MPPQGSNWFTSYELSLFAYLSFYKDKIWRMLYSDFVLYSCVCCVIKKWSLHVNTPVGWKSVCQNIFQSICNPGEEAFALKLTDQVASQRKSWCVGQGGRRAPPVPGRKGNSGWSTFWAGPVQFYKKLLDGEKTVASRELTVEETGGRTFFIYKTFYSFKWWRVPNDYVSFKKNGVLYFGSFRLESVADKPKQTQMGASTDCGPWSITKARFWV